MQPDETEKSLKTVTIYTDGACINNPGPGGYGVVLLFGEHRKELAGGFAHTTNNRMETTAAIVGLEALKTPCQVTLYTDSKYLVETMMRGWAKRWKANGWWRTKTEQAVNSDLWEKLLALCEKHSVEFLWVKGHAGNPENERCDRLASEAALQKNLPIDTGYKPKPNETVRQSSQKAFDFAETQPKPTAITSSKGQYPKISHIGQPCRKCGTAVIKKLSKRHERKPNQSYYYEYYLYCPSCETMYMVEEAKVMF